MIKQKKKVCDSCEELTYIWKNYGGMRWCKQCWSRQQAKEGLKKPITSAIRHSSTRRQKKDNEYLKLRKRYLSENSLCKVKVKGCTTHATDVHHTRGGSERDVYYLIQSTWLPVCRSCHNWIHTNPKEARELNYLK